ncbi:hypothetical protein R5R35_008213 [Gryllus longicercus]|uniref:Accessory gland protein n=1 Tax=Gryllus longicercus TaxID=2509291 RepID=A0AAN9YYY7_9ORTH
MANAQKVCLALLVLSSVKTLTALLFTKEADSASELSAWSDEEELERAACVRPEERSTRSLGQLFGGDGGGVGGGDGSGGLGSVDLLSLRAIFDMALGVLRALRRGAEVDVERARAADAQQRY